MSRSAPDTVDASCRYFGTDGIRDVVGQGLLAVDAVERWGCAVAAHLVRTRPGGQVLIGRDTRDSGPGIAEILAGALARAGFPVGDAGVCPTAAVSHAVRAAGAAMGIVVSASHNPAEYNGIKIVDATGRKLAPAEERRIEILWEEGAAPPPAPGGAVTPFAWEARYLADLERHFAGLSLSGRRVVLDAASGAAHDLAPRVFARFGARPIAIDPTPDGRNINAGTGALHPERTRDACRRESAFFGFAFDGDADRTLPVDETGTLRDGDDVIAFAVAALRRRDARAPVTAVATVLSNAGLDRFVASRGGRLVRCEVGDRAVTEAVDRTGAQVGGEPSGHVVFPDWGPTGDGVATALSILALAERLGLAFAPEIADFARSAAAARAIRVSRRPALVDLPAVAEALRAARAELEGTGRVLLRYSGTEPVARVLVEAPDPRICDRLADALADAIRAEIGA